MNPETKDALEDVLRNGKAIRQFASEHDFESGKWCGRELQRCLDIQIMV